MLGSVRLLLALGVMVTHLWAADGGIAGEYAVFGFYVLSGFLITRVLNDVYRFALARFALNRMLKLLPIYYLVAVATAGLLLVLPDARAFNSALWVDADVSRWAANLAIVPLVDRPPEVFRLIPPSWSLAVEIVNYGLLWLVVARSWKAATLALVLAVSVHLILLANGAPHSDRYYPIYAALLPFSLGASAYFLRRQLEGRQRVKLCIGLAGVSVTGLAWLGGLISSSVSSLWGEIFLYASTGALAVAIVWIADDVGLGWLRKSDRFLGDLAYPVFLVHWILGYLVTLALGLPKGFGLFLAALPVVLSIAVALSWIGRAIVEPVRDAVRPTSTQFPEGAGAPKLADHATSPSKTVLPSNS